MERFCPVALPGSVRAESLGVITSPLSCQIPTPLSRTPPPSLQQRLSEVLALRASDSQQQAMLRAYLSEIELPQGAKALEIGCGTGAISRALVDELKLEVTGLDPSLVFVARARELGKHLSGLTFVQGDGRALSFGEATFDLVVFHTTLCDGAGGATAYTSENLGSPG